MKDFKINFQDNEEHTILNLMNKWKNATQNPIMNSKIEINYIRNFLKNLGFTNIRKQGDKFNATLYNHRYFGLWLDTTFPQFDLRFNQRVEKKETNNA